MLQIGTGHIGPHLYLCVLMDVESRYIIAFRFGKSGSEKLKQNLCSDAGINIIPPSSRIMSSFFSALSAEQILLHKFNDNEERMETVVKWINYYNTKRPHSSLDYKTPSEVFIEKYHPLKFD